MLRPLEWPGSTSLSAPRVTCMVGAKQAASQVTDNELGHSYKHNWASYVLDPSFTSQMMALNTASLGIDHARGCST
jgi:hypothetical protein